MVKLGCYSHFVETLVPKCIDKATHNWKNVYRHIEGNGFFNLTRFWLEKTSLKLNGLSQMSTLRLKAQKLEYLCHVKREKYDRKWPYKVYRNSHSALICLQKNVTFFSSWVWEVSEEWISWFWSGSEHEMPCFLRLLLKCRGSKANGNSGIATNIRQISKKLFINS